MRLYVEDVVEKELLEGELNGSSIPSEYLEVESSVLGKSSLVDGRLGYFEVTETDFRLASEILDNIRESRINDAIAPGKRNQIVTVPRILVSLLILFLVGGIGFLMYENSRLKKLSHYAENISDYTRKWNTDKTILSRYFKDSGLLEAEYFDSNFNGKWEKEKFYDKRGILRSVDISPDDDGTFLFFLYYNQNGQLVQRYIDSKETMRNRVFDIAVNPETYYEFTDTSSNSDYYAVRKVDGQLDARVEK